MAQGDTSGNGSESLLGLYEQLLRVRRCEERLAALFADGEVPGFIHLSIGQEAVAVGVASALGAADTFASTHRGHGHAIARGIALDRFFAELLARKTGVCGGRGGSMHVADMGIGMLGANGIVGAGVPIALGSALAHKLRGTGGIAVSFFGDGALAEGVVHESANIAALWNLPILFVCEANGWSEFSPVSRQIAFNLADWARSYGLEYRKTDGNDVLAVAQVAGELVTSLRGGGRAGLLECTTTRVRGHYEGDAQRYRDRDEAKGDDPLIIAERQLADAGTGPQVIAQVTERIEQEIEAAIAAARAAPPARFEDALADVYTGVPA